MPAQTHVVYVGSRTGLQYRVAGNDAMEDLEPVDGTGRVYMQHVWHWCEGRSQLPTSGRLTMSGAKVVLMQDP
jgi:hypothetical protein